MEENIQEVEYASPTSKDILLCYDIENASYPSNEAASLSSLQYRQEHALDYFQCTITHATNTEDEKERKIIGFICGTRTNSFQEESMTTHDPKGRILAIHSVVVSEEYRRKGIATAMMKHYLENVMNNVDSSNISSIMLLAKEQLLGFYVKCGFRVNRPSPIVHGDDLWYELEMNLVRKEEASESWFCKTEQFKRPYPDVKPYLEEHKQWMIRLRKEGYCITSGYRVDGEGKPGGGGLMILAAKDYNEALEIVLTDPLVANDCVDWTLNGWNSQIGNLELR